MVLSSNFMTFIDCYKDRKVILYTRVKESQKLFAQYHIYYLFTMKMTKEETQHMICHNLL